MKQKTPVETHELLMACRRLLRAVGTRAKHEDPIIIKELLQLREYLDNVIQNAVVGQRDAGMTWQLIADELGVTRQACIMRWGNSNGHSHSFPPHP
jgi:hypothetical protein